MNERGYAKRLVVIAAMLLTAGCADVATGPRPEAKEAKRITIKPLCKLGCVGSDPHPDAPGVYLNSMTPDFCFSTQGDLDHDHVADLCEQYLALAFDPELAATGSPVDNIGREPRWAVRRVQDLDEVMIAYLASYYVDGGASDPNCQGIPGLCDGHYGDSEMIVLLASYNEATQHWVLVGAYLSQHGAYEYHYANSQYVEDLTYPAHPGAYPRIWVSSLKHANYISALACESGFPHYDHCLSPHVYVRLGSLGNGNVGGSLVQNRLLDCVYSTNPFYSSNPPECYWTGARFDGWQGVQPDSDPYNSKLTDFLFF